jgi:CheY-like chemotaxis protein
MEAVDAVRTRQYDVVLMDMRMPEMDGLEATRVLRAERRENQPRIVALTANTSQEDRAQCLAAGMEDFLTKPLATASLVSALKATVRRNARSRSSPGVDNDVLNELRRLTNGDAGLLRELIDLYLDTSARLMHELTAALSASNATSAARAAHSLKGSAAQVGATAVAQHASAMEQALSRGNLEEANGILSALELAQANISGELARACVAP